VKPLEEATDNQLMKQVQAGDLPKMGLLYERHSKDVFAYFFRCTRDRAKSEDLVQNVFLRLIRYRQTFTGEGQFRYWIFATARNVWFDDHRRKDPLKRREDLTLQNEAIEFEPGPDRELEIQERKDIVHRALLRLTPEKREAIILSRFQGLKYHEIAIISNCTENAIKSRVQRGLLDLKELMQNIEM